MNHKRLEQLLALAAKTGDRLIVYDSSGKLEPFVLMDLAGYERLLASQHKDSLAAGETSTEVDTYEFEPISAQSEGGQQESI